MKGKVREICHFGPQKGQKGYETHSMAVKKSRKYSSSLIYSYFVDSAFTAVERNVEFTKYVKGVLFINITYTKGLPFLSKMVFNPLSPNI